MAPFEEDDDSVYDLGFSSRRGRSTTRRSEMNSEESSRRSARATSVFPATLKHFDDLGQAEIESGYSNAGLYRARRALSEARIIASEINSSQARESSVYESTEKIKSKKSSLSQYQSASSGEQSFGNYKITVTPRAESWSSFPGRRLWSSRSVTQALLEKYNPSQFPDFIFGTYGPGRTLNEPISATHNFYQRSLRDEYEGQGVASSRLGQASRMYELDDSSYDSSLYNLNSSARNYRAKSTMDRSADYDYASNDLYNSRAARGKSSTYALDSSKMSRATMEKAAALEKDSATESYLDGVASAYGLGSAGKRSASTARGRSASAARTYEMDEASRGYFDKYAVDLNEKAKKYYDDEEPVDYLPLGPSMTRIGSRAPVRATPAPGAGAGYPGYDEKEQSMGPGTRALRIGNHYHEYPDSTRDSTNIVKPSILSKFYHYYIPKHYSATPMLGGFMVPAASAGTKYGWKY